MGGAHPDGGLAPRAAGIDGDDGRRPRDAGALDHRLADAAAADHRHAGPRGHAGGDQAGAEAGGDPAAEQGQLVVGQVGLDRDHRGLVDHHGLGERAAAAHRGRRRPSGRRKRGAPGCPAPLAVVGHAVDAPPAGPARGRDRGQHPVAGAHAAHLGADLLDHATGLVAGHDGQRQRRRPAITVRSVWQMPLAAMRTSTSRGPRARGLQVLHHQRLARLVGDGDPHRARGAGRAQLDAAP